MTNKDILRIALEQQAIDSNCRPEDFLQSENKVVISKANPKARKYLELPFFCDLCSYGSNIVASVDRSVVDVVSKFINKNKVEHCFQTPNLYMLNEELEKHGMKICFMAEYFLPDVEAMEQIPCEYEIRMLYPTDFINLYTGQWSNALAETRKELDVLAAGAYDGETLIGLAGCSADCESMWQIGIDVLPEYRRKGIAAALTNRLAREVLALGKVPFYCCAWANLGSARNAIRSGFRPAWVHVTAKGEEFVRKMSE